MRLSDITRMVACACFVLLSPPLSHAAESASSDTDACATSQRSADLSAEEKVRCVLLAYIKATEAADAEGARALFHADARMSGDLGNGARTGSPEPFFQSLSKAASRPGEGGYEASVDSISIMGDTATGNVIEKNLFGYDFTNRFHLIKLDGRWQIVSKLFYSSGLAKQSDAGQRKP
jgi:hypothetical protein